MPTSRVSVYYGDALGRYGFPNEHPFGPDRQGVFWEECLRLGLDQWVHVADPVLATEDMLSRFHTKTYIEQVKTLSQQGEGYLDQGDTPAYSGVYEAAACVAGCAVSGAERLMAQDCKRVFVPIGGLHHAKRDAAEGFCVFNDAGIVIENLFAHAIYSTMIKRVAYVDIDAHHGNGVYYGFENDPRVIFADIHEDGRFIYPGTGRRDEIGLGSAKDTKLNIPIEPGSGEKIFYQAWQEVEIFLEQHQPDFFIFQVGVDSLRGDPLTHLNFSTQTHYDATVRMIGLAEKYAQGRLLILGGGGYDRRNIAEGWCSVLRALIETY